MKLTTFYFWLTVSVTLLTVSVGYTSKNSIISRLQNRHRAVSAVETSTATVTQTAVETAVSAVSPEADGDAVGSIPRVGGPMPPNKPDWYRVPAPGGGNTRFEALRSGMRALKLNTVCEEAQCPNIGECWNGGTATIMVLGDTCTRGCRFCAVKTSSKPPPADPAEPFNTAMAIASWGVDYVVLTSVDRDDMVDGGADHFGKTVEFLKLQKPAIIIECLVSDFQGKDSSVNRLANCGLDVYAHNLETVERLQRFVRDNRANYHQSMEVLRKAKVFNPKIFTKTSLMLGLGETDSEVIKTMEELRAIDVDVVTFGQYLKPTDHHLAVSEYVSPEKFDKFRELGEEMGFKYVASGPLVRSSYKAGEYFMQKMVGKNRPPPDGSASDSTKTADVTPPQGEAQEAPGVKNDSKFSIFRKKKENEKKDSKNIVS